MEEDKKIVVLQDTTNGFGDERFRALYNWITENPEEAIKWINSMSQQTQKEQPKKKRLLPKVNKNPKPTMY